MKIRYLLVLAVASWSSQALMAATVKIPPIPAAGSYDEKSGSDPVQVCNAIISEGPPQTHLDKEIPTFNLVVNPNNPDDGFSGLCVPRIVVGYDKRLDENFVKKVMNKALCSMSGNDGLEAIIEVTFSSKSISYNGSFIEVVDGVATGLTEPDKSTLKPHVGTCPSQG